MDSPTTSSFLKEISNETMNSNSLLPANTDVQAQVETSNILQTQSMMNGGNGVLTGVYSNTGFDMIKILARLTNRLNPQIQLGPIDLSCSFVVSDAKKYDCPVIYCSPAFERLTGYTNKEIIGKNCRFLQSPDGQVTCGSRRQHTDNKAVYHIKSQLNQGKEHQASIINYRKGGQPFVNLVTVIPIFDDYGQVEYFVGLQVDLVEQPNSILEKMKDGTYLINYHTPQSTLPLAVPSSNKLLTVDEYFHELPSNSNSITLTTTTDNTNSIAQNSAIVDLLDSSQIDYENSFTCEQQIQREWNKLLLEQSSDFIHVLSLKGVFLYTSGSSMDMLEYNPEELVGHPLSFICHPSDIIPVTREIKDATTNPDKMINLLFRIRRKYSGYIWIDCRGTVYSDQSKGRKCLVLSGRERPVYRLLDHQITTTVSASSDSDMNVNHDKEYWAKLTLAGLYLHVTPTCKNVVGFTSDVLEHESIYQYASNNAVTDITRALEVAKGGQIVKVLHTTLNSKGSYVAVQSTFYPGDTACNVGLPSFVLLQVTLLENDNSAEDEQEARLQQLSPYSQVENEVNIFSELETIRSTNWQYELHQLQQSNKKMREQLEKYSNLTKRGKKKKTKIRNSLKICAKCQTQDSPEWRKGPNGPKELCNACGLRYSKSLGTLKK